MTLTQHLKPDLDPVQLGRLEELRRLQTAEQMFSIERLRPLLVELVEDPTFQQLLVGHADLDGMIRGAPASTARRGTALQLSRGARGLSCGRFDAVAATTSR